MIDPDWLTSPFYKFPSWTCPECQQGQVGAAKIQYASDKGVGFAIDQGFIERSDNSGVFACVMTCNQGHCEQGIAVSGSFRTELDDVGDYTAFGNAHTVRCIIPPPRIISLPENVPGPVAKAIELSFILYWVDIGACVSTIRIAIERLVDSFSPPGGNFEPLERRLQRLSVNTDLKRAAKLIKDLGNAGAHGAAVDRSKLFTAYELLELELRLLFNNDDHRRQQLRDALELPNNPPPTAP